MRVTPECDSINSLSICSEDGIQTDPCVAFDGTNYMVVWSDMRVTGNKVVYVARVSQSGTVLDPGGVQIGPENGSWQNQPSIVFLGDKYFLAWGHLMAPFGVTGCFVNLDGTLDDTVRIASATAEVHNTCVVYDGEKMLVTWTEYAGTLWGQFVSTSGSAIGSPFIIATDIMVTSSGSTCFSGSEYMVVYCNWAFAIIEFWGRKYDASGNPLGSPFRIANPAHSSTDGYVIAGDEHYLCLWSKLLYPADIYGSLDFDVGVEDHQTRPLEQGLRYTSTITSGPLALPDDKEFKVFDIMGCEVRTTNPAPGIYFIQIESDIVQKVIKVK
ncbi:MAG: hypothetical protein JSV53_05415 [candidate division WOR-3 bacterium]|nr:MAG: hypothetical protein JSV53_05415 [candidate division WOR-3 bacterium]